MLMGNIFGKSELYVEIRNLFINKKYKTLIRSATKYLNIYGDDENVIFMRAKSYRTLEMFDESINDLNYILNNINNNNDYALVELFYEYYYLNKYKEAFDMLLILYEKKTINAYSLSIAELVIRKSLNMDIPIGIKRIKRIEYIKNQILDYKEEATLAHLKNHIEGSNDENKTYFRKDINLKYLIDSVKENLKESKKVNTDEMLELHYFDVPNVGYENNNFNSYNCIKVVVVPNTTNIITIYPVKDEHDGCSNILNCDYDILFNKEKVKEKTISQIEKFNKRFKKV